MSSGFSWTLPAPTAAGAGRTAAIDEGTRDLFGYDILFKNGDLPLTRGGDYIRVGGVENLRLAVYRRLTTPPGTYRFRPAYGVGVQAWVKKPKTQANLDALRNACVDNLSQDRRITQVDVSVTTAKVNNVEVVRVAVKITAGGQTHSFEPFTFAEEA